MVVARLLNTLLSDPEKLIPQSSWEDGSTERSKERRVCDYISGMTDSYAERLYKRLFTPGFGSSGDELRTFLTELKQNGSNGPILPFTGWLSLRRSFSEPGLV